LVSYDKDFDVEPSTPTIARQHPPSRVKTTRRSNPSFFRCGQASSGLLRRFAPRNLTGWAGWRVVLDLGGGLWQVGA
jgi:hypothetical protein